MRGDGISWIGSVFFWNLLIVLSLPSTFAMLGVSPVSQSVDFSPGLDRSYKFYFTGDADATYAVVAEGDFAQYTTITPVTLKGEGYVTVRLRLPREASVPGAHVIFIVARQKPPQANAGVTLLGAVKSTVVVHVPYPGKYATLTFEASNAKAGEPVPFSLKVSNLGTQEIIAAPRISLINGENTSVSSFALEMSTIQSTQSKSYAFEANTSSYRAGFYRALATVEYGGKTPATHEARFRLGELAVNVTSTSDRLTKNKLNRFDIQIESLWNDPLENVYADVEVLNHSMKFTTPSTSLNGFEKATLTGYFDTTGIEKEPFQVRIVLHYAGTTSERTVAVRFVREIPYLLIALIAGFALLIAVIIRLIVWMRRLQQSIVQQKQVGNRRGKKNE